MEKNKETIISIDPGKSHSGVAVLVDRKIREGLNVENKELVPFIKQESLICEKLVLVIEDMRPYNMRITNEVIDTIKFIGQLQWRLDELNMRYTLIPRWQIKKWVFLQFRTMAEPEIQKRIDYSVKRKLEKKAQTGDERPIKIPIPTFVWVDDRIVQQAMRIRWGIKKPRVGQKAEYNLKDHSWQALATASFHLVSSPR